MHLLMTAGIGQGFKCQRQCGLCDRADDQIGMQELLAVPLALTSFVEVLKDSLVTAYIDNVGVLCALLRGGWSVADINQSVGHCWLDIARNRMGFHAARVESKANIADEPTRDDFTFVRSVRAVWVEPVLLAWCFSLWQFPSDVYQ